MNEDLKKILAFLASSAMGCMGEPHIYGSLRLLQALELLIRYALEHESCTVGGLEQIADRIAAEKFLCMTDPEGFKQLADSICIEMVKKF